MTSEAVALLASLRRIGVELRADAGLLRYRPRAAVAPELVAALARNKPALLSILVTQWGETSTTPTDNAAKPSKTEALSALSAPGSGVSDDTNEGVPLGEDIPGPGAVLLRVRCYACLSTHWWRRVGNQAEWFCTRCAPPLPGIEIEVRDA